MNGRRPEWLPSWFGMQGSAPPPPFDPSQLPGLRVWLDASSSANFAFSGTDILTWFNLAPGGEDYVVQSASPVLQPAIQNGLSAVYFDNTTTFQQLGNSTTQLFTGASGYYMACVVQPTTYINLPLFFAVNNDQTFQYMGFGFSQIGVYGDIMMNGFETGTQPGFGANTPNGFVLDILGKTNQYGFTYDGSGYDMTNIAGFGLTFNTTPLSLFAAAGVGPQTGVNTVGGWGGNGNRINGYIMEVVFCDQMPTPDLIAAMEAYYVTKWGL